MRRALGLGLQRLGFISSCHRVFTSTWHSAAQFNEKDYRMNAAQTTLATYPQARLNWVLRDRTETLAQSLTAAACLTLMVVLLSSLFA